MPDPLELLQQDHQAVAQLYEELGQTDDPSRRRALADEMIDSLTRHAALEEDVLYPAVVERVDGARGFVATNLEEHRHASELMHRLEKLQPDQPDFSPTVGLLMKGVKVHVAAEEKQLFPRIRAAMTTTELVALGARIEESRGRAPAPARQRTRTRKARS